MSMNWRERFLQTKTSDMNIHQKVMNLHQRSYNFIKTQRQKRIDTVGADGAITRFYRYPASRDNNYPAYAKYNFAILDVQGRKRYLTPLECSDLGFDFEKGTSQITPFSKNFGDSFYVEFCRAEEQWEKSLHEKTAYYREQAQEIQDKHQNKPWRLPLYQEYLQSREWKQKRSEVLFRDGHSCQLCGDEEDLQIHHLTYNRVGDEALFDLVTLCSHCHAKEHGKEE